MRAWFSCTGAELLARDVEDTLGRLAAAQADRGLSTSVEQNEAWARAIAALKEAVEENGGEGWTIALEYDLVRLEKRIDAVVLTDRVILVLEFKGRAIDAAALRQVEDYALDLRDFHARSQAHPIIPILVAGEISPRPDRRSLSWPDVAQPLATRYDRLGVLIQEILRGIPTPKVPLDGDAWLAAPYRPVPTIIEAATLLYATHGVAEISHTRADAANLTRTAAAIDRIIEAAKRSRSRFVVFVTGIPGSGKTLCGLNTVFARARDEGAAFLSGNAPLIAVLRASLARDAVARGVPKVRRCAVSGPPCRMCTASGRTMQLSRSAFPPSASSCSMRRSGHGTKRRPAKERNAARAG